MDGSDQVLPRYDYCRLVPRIGCAENDDSVNSEHLSILGSYRKLKLLQLNKQENRRLQQKATMVVVPNVSMDWCPRQFTKARAVQDYLKYNPMDFHEKVNNSRCVSGEETNE
jgi:hypothetical protein